MFFQDELDPFTPPQQVRPLPPQETQSRLDQLGSGLVGGLGYLGDILDKTFGGRAVRGALGGNARELLSVLPGSDTLGITNYSDRVSGKQLLGLDEPTDPEEGFSWDDAKGLGLEVALDPSMWFGAAIPKLVAGGLNKGAKAASSGLEALTNVNPYTYAGKGIDEAKRIGSSLFDRTAGGAWGTANQSVARDTYFPTLDTAVDTAKREYNKALTPVDELVKGGYDQNLTMRATMQAGLGDLPGAVRSLQAAGYSPIDAAKALDAATTYRQRAAELSQGMEQSEGALSKTFSDVPEWKLESQLEAKSKGIPFPDFGAPPTNYVRRSLVDDVGGINYGNNRNAMSAVSESQIGREDIWKGLGGDVAINDLIKKAHDPAAPLNHLQIKAEATKMLTDNPSGTIPSSWAGTSWGKIAQKGLDKQTDDLANAILHIPPQRAQEGFFSEDLFGNMHARELSAARTTASAKTIVAGLSKELGQVQEVKHLQNAGIPYTRVTDFLEGAGLTHVDPTTGLPVAQEKVAQSLGISAQAASVLKNNLHDYGIPNDVAQDMLRIGQAIKIPSTLKPVVDAFTNATQNLKANLTYPFPSFNVRNLMTGFFNMFRDNALNPTAIKEMQTLQRGGTISDEVATKLYPGLSAKEASIELRNEMMASRSAFVHANQVHDVAGTESAVIGGFKPGDMPAVGGVAKGLGESVMDWGSRNLPKKGNLSPFNSETFFMAKAGREAANAGEDLTRGSHYLAKRLQGASPAEAKMATLKYQLDYQNMTEFEKTVMKRLFPFYSFTRRNLPPLLEDLVKQPAKLTGAIRASSYRPDGGFVPEYLGEGSAINLGKGANGETRFLASMGLPFEDEGFKILGNLAHGNVTRSLQEVAGMASPILKTLPEQAAGTQFSTGRKLTDLKQNYAGKAIAELGLDEPFPGLPQQVSQLAGGSPFARFLTTAGKLTDPRKDTAAKMANLLTGVQLTDVDLPRQAQLAVRDQVKQQLAASPLAREWSEVYVPQEKIAQLSPSELDAYRFYKALEAKGKREAEQRKHRQMLSVFE